LFGWVDDVELEKIIMMSLPNNAKWKIILISDLLLGLLLCFGLLTGYSWNNELANLVFPPAVSFTGIIIVMFKKKIIVFRKWVDAIAYTPSLLVGIPYNLSTILLISVSLFFISNTFIEEKVGWNNILEFNPEN
jgi:hypothetical protein